MHRLVDATVAAAGARTRFVRGTPCCRAAAATKTEWPVCHQRLWIRIPGRYARCRHQAGMRSTSLATSLSIASSLQCSKRAAAAAPLAFRPWHTRSGRSHHVHGRTTSHARLCGPPLTLQTAPRVPIRSSLALKLLYTGRRCAGATSRPAAQQSALDPWPKRARAGARLAPRGPSLARQNAPCRHRQAPQAGGPAQSLKRDTR